MVTKRIIGLDPGLRFTGWGVIETEGNKLRHIANGVVKSTSDWMLSDRLLEIQEGLQAAMEAHNPTEAAVEETFVNQNPTTTLKLGMARGVVIFSAAKFGLRVVEYKPNKVKKTVTGVGHANKEQIQMMIRTLLPTCQFDSADAADALAIAICHSRYEETNSKIIDNQIKKFYKR